MSGSLVPLRLQFCPKIYNVFQLPLFFRKFIAGPGLKSNRIIKCKMGSFKGKTAIVTGGTSGMGEAIACKLASEGSNLVIGGRDPARGEAVVSGIAEKGGNAVFVPGGVENVSVNKEMVDVALARFGRLDIAVLCAGDLGIGKLTELSVDSWRKTIDINLNSVFYLLKHAIPAMEGGGGGNVVIIGSVAAFHAFPSHPAYCASKGALVSLVRQVAADYGPSIRINLVCPAQVDTPLLRDSVRAFSDPHTIIERTRERLPLKRLGTTGDIAEAACFLAGDGASWITGTCLTVDGGFLCT
jgi:NAD(P)-dependent dehydrogenase (short-subunit alcohol dehydrogenase family)